MEKQSRCVSLREVRGSPQVRTPHAHHLRLLLFLSRQLLSAVPPSTSPHNMPALLQETLLTICPFAFPVLNLILRWARCRKGRTPPNPMCRWGGPKLTRLGCCSWFVVPLPPASWGLTQGPRSSQNSILTHCSPVPKKCCTCCSWGNYSQARNASLCWKDPSYVAMDMMSCF